MACTRWSPRRSLATAADISPVLRDEYLGRSRECHFVYAHVQSDRGPRRWTVSRQNIDDSRRKPGLSKQYKRKQSLAEITTEPSKTAGGVGGSGPNPSTLPAENRGNNKKDVAMEEEAGGNTAFPRWTRPHECDHPAVVFGGFWRGHHDGPRLRFFMTFQWRCTSTRSEDQTPLIQWY